MLPENKSSMLFPTFISSSGYYKIIAQKTAYKVEYFQECKIKPSFMKDIYIKSAEKEAVDFLSELKKYVQRTCH